MTKNSSNQTEPTSLIDQSASFWANQTVTKQICSQISKEINETYTNKNNIIIFGLEAKQDKIQDDVSIKKLITNIEKNIDFSKIKIKRFKAKTAYNIKPTVQVLFESEND